MAQLTAFAAYEGTNPNDLVPWIWGFEPVMVCFVILLASPAFALGYTVLSAFTPLISSLIFVGTASHAVAAQTPIHIGNVAFVVIFLGIRSRLASLHEVERQARESERESQLVKASAERREALARVVHDEVLSTLIAEMRLPGAPNDTLRGEASRALDTVTMRIVELEDAPFEPGECVQAIRQVAARIAPDCVVNAQLTTGEKNQPNTGEETVTADRLIPRVVVTAMEQALGEALRNSVRHAASATRRELTIVAAPNALRVTLSDDGPGFDVLAVSPARLGVRGSVIGRMNSLPGGHSTIRSGDFGTVVELSWAR